MGFNILATTLNEDAIPAGERWCRFPVPAIGKDDALLILKKCSGAEDSVPCKPALQVSYSNLNPWGVSTSHNAFVVLFFTSLR